MQINSLDAKKPPRMRLEEPVRAATLPDDKCFPASGEDCLCVQTSLSECHEAVIDFRSTQAEFCIAANFFKAVSALQDIAWAGRGRIYGRQKNCPAPELNVR